MGAGDISRPSGQRKKPEFPVEGGGPVGCGCGVLLGLTAGVAVFISHSFGIWIITAIAIVSGVLGWKFGDDYFEKVLSGGDPEGKPTRWFFWW